MQLVPSVVSRTRVLLKCLNPWVVLVVNGDLGYSRALGQTIDRFYRTEMIPMGSSLQDGGEWDEEWLRYR